METLKKAKGTSPVKKTARKSLLDLNKFFGKIIWKEDPVKYQRKLRDGK